MAVRFRDVATTTGVDASAEGTIPTLAQPGDLLLAFLNHAASGATMTTPATGWSLQVADPNPNDFSCLFYSKIMVPSEAAPTWTWSVAGNWTVDIIALFGHDPTNPLNIVNGQQVTATGVTITLTGTPTVNDVMFVGWASTDATGGARTWTETGSMTEALDRVDNQHHHVLAYENLTGGILNSQSRTYTVSGTAQDLASFLALVAPDIPKPAAILDSAAIL